MVVDAGWRLKTVQDSTRAQSSRETSPSGMRRASGSTNFLRGAEGADGSGAGAFGALAGAFLTEGFGGSPGTAADSFFAGLRRGSRGAR